MNLYLVPWEEHPCGGWGCGGSYGIDLILATSEESAANICRYENGRNNVDDERIKEFKMPSLNRRKKEGPFIP